MALVDLVATPRLALSARARSKKSQRVRSPRRRSSVYVSSPMQPGQRELVERVIDPIDAMFSRKQITERQNTAADIYRKAWSTIYGSIGGSMDFDRVRGGGMPGKPPATPFMNACERLGEAKRWLYARDHRVLELIAGHGYSIGESADMIAGRLASRLEREDVGRHLRDGLNELADRWLGALFRKESAHIVSDRSFDDAEFEIKTGELQRSGSVAHATRTGVKMRRRS